MDGRREDIERISHAVQNLNRASAAAVTAPLAPQQRREKKRSSGLPAPEEADWVTRRTTGPRRQVDFDSRCGFPSTHRD